jgi:hypothetical protein
MSMPWHQRDDRGDAVTRLIRPLLVGLAVVAVVWFVEPSIVLVTARSPRGLAAVAATIVIVSGAGRLARRWGRKASITARTALAVACCAVLVLPALRQRRLDEPLPEPVRLAAPAASATESAPGPGSAPAPEPAPAARPIGESPLPVPTTTSSTTPRPQRTEQDVGPAAVPSVTAPTAETPTSVRAGPQRITTGDLEGIGHQASGEVSVFRQEDGSYFVRFEDVDIRGAPDPVLYLVPGRDRRSREGGTEIAPLKATRGSFNHTLPASFPFDGDFTVFVWCERYATPIAAADQQPV